ncbi:MAG TPA: Mur ligase family protein, partial [Chloroflexota bacterium]|nr:Mur ligase family protein [Chloroflexota bacterium]
MTEHGDRLGPNPLRPGGRVHLIGVAGAGMNALATLLLIRGYVVSGSDQQTSVQVERLIGQGMTFYLDHDPAQVTGADLVIISAAVHEHNVELAAAHAAGTPVVKRAEALGWLLADSRVIAVAGTHGKTTTSAMLAVILTHAGAQPTFVVGGEVLDLGASASIGAGAWAVVEADEYDRSFLHLHPAIALITNVEPDHLEYYGSVEAMHEAYHQFIDRIIPGGALVRNLADPFSRALVDSPDRALIDCALSDIRPQPEAPGQRASAVVAPAIQPPPEAPPSKAGLETRTPKHPASAIVPPIRPQPEALSDPASWFASDLREDSQGSHFLLHYPGGTCPVDLRLSGRHNISNAVQALAAAAHAGVSPEIAAAALGRFHGTGRRFQPVGEAGGVLVIDDYAH